jgi:4-hydroxy-tetrahydrodipicolinate synthase
MKAGMYLAGVLADATVRPPTEAPGRPEMEALKAATRQAGLLAR